MRRIRTFVAIDVGQAIRNKLIALQESLRELVPDVKWVEPENLHVTLMFLGEVNSREMPRVCHTVNRACQPHRVFHLTIESLGAFPTPRRPRTLWAGVGEGAAEVTAIHKDVETALLELGGFRRETRQFTPHITLGRVRGEEAALELAPLLASKANWTAGGLEVFDVHVMSSELTPQGPIYTVLGTAKLNTSYPRRKK